MLQGLWSTLQNMFKCSVVSTCSDVLNYFVQLSKIVKMKTTILSSNWKWSMVRDQALTGVRNFRIRTPISLQIFELPEI